MQSDLLISKKYFTLPELTSKPKLLGTGIGCQALVSEHFFVVLDLRDKSFSNILIEKAEMPAKDSLLNGNAFNMTYRLSNLIVEQPDNSKKGLIEFRHLRMTVDDSSLCHKTCKNKCIEPFIVCSLRRSQ
jgi:hypothetical protein